MKKFLAVLMSIAMLSGMMACGNKSEASNPVATSPDGSTPSVASPDAEPITIEFWYAFGDKVGANSQRLADEFNKSQDKIIVKAEYQGAGYNDLHAKVQAAMAAKNAPAVTYNELTVMENFAKSGITQPLDDFMAKDNMKPEEFISGLLANTFVDDKFYGVPFMRSTPLVYYNATLFEAAGVKDPPKTFDDMMAVSKTLTKPGEVTGLVTGVTTWIYEALVYSSGGQLLNEAETEAVFNSPDAMKAMEFYRKGMKEGVFKITTGADAVSQAKMDFQNKHSGMIMDSTANLSFYMEVAKNAGFTLGTAYMPSNGISAVPTGGCNMVMTAGLSPEVADAAWEFIKFCASKEQTIKTSIATGYMPCRVSAVDDPVMMDFYKQNPQFKVAVEQLTNGVPRPANKNFAKVNALLLDTLMQCVIDIDSDPQPVMDKAVLEANKILAK